MRLDELILGVTRCYRCKGSKGENESRGVRIVLTVLHLLTKLGPAADDTFTIRAPRKQSK